SGSSCCHLRSLPSWYSLRSWEPWSWLGRSANDSAVLVPDSRCDSVCHRRGLFSNQAQHHHDFHVDLTHAQRREFDLRGLRHPLASGERTGLRLFCNGCGSGRSSSGIGNCSRHIPHARDLKCGSGEPAQTMNSSPNFNLWVIPILPLIGSAINGLFGKRFPRSLVSTIALLFPGAAFAVALWVVSQFAGLSQAQIPHIERLFPWIEAGGFRVDYGFYLDQLSVTMLLVVTGVGFLIHTYSVGYMAEEGGYYRFFSYLNLFMFFMLTLVLAHSYLLMFVGWEGVGLASYLLIGFFFRKHSAAQAGKKAFITNRIGDFAFLLGMFLLIKNFHSLDYSVIFKEVGRFPVEQGVVGTLTATALLLMVGACGKSAQIPLYVWLPDAMEGPTPVSALIHAATMVTAGIYMIARSNAIFIRAPYALLIVAIIGALTAIFAASIGLVQTDIKRVLAYSTVSQLGYMFMACGVAAFSAGIFHLMTHAFFKA